MMRIEPRFLFKAEKNIGRKKGWNFPFVSPPNGRVARRLRLDFSELQTGGAEDPVDWESPSSGYAALGFANSRVDTVSRRMGIPTHLLGKATHFQVRELACRNGAFPWHSVGKAVGSDVYGF
jgi:hypothetical protein